MTSRIIHVGSRSLSLATTLRGRRAERSFRVRLPISSAVIRSWVVTVVAALVLAAPASVLAQAEVEADPIAYALNGFSLHVGGIVGSYRFSVGTFGIDIPRVFHGNDEWRASMRGAGIKADLLGGRIDGFFVGGDANYYRMSYTLEETAETAKRNEFSVGLRGGYRLPIGRAGLYLAPWVGVGYSFGGDVEIGERTFGHTPTTIFPTVHIGWRF